MILSARVAGDWKYSEHRIHSRRAGQPVSLHSMAVVWTDESGERPVSTCASFSASLL
jgi:hypothetical protein